MRCVGECRRAYALLTTSAGLGGGLSFAYRYLRFSLSRYSTVSSLISSSVQKPAPPAQAIELCRRASQPCGRSGTTILKVPTNSAENIPAPNIENEPTRAQVSEQRTQVPEDRGAEETRANLAAIRRPAQTSNDEANWITLTSVNLRERPTRSARAIGVVAKDTKLRVIGRKKR